MTVGDLDRIFKAYDVRGVVPDDLDEDIARRIGAAFAEWSGGPSVVIGRDCRLSSPDLAAALTDGITSRGIGVIDLGLASTDLLYFASGSLDLPAIMLTASHNPKQYNGLKFCLAGAKPVGEESGLLDVQALTEQDLPPTGEPGAVEHRDLLPAYVEHVLTFLDASRMRPLTVAIDTANGMGGLVAPAVFERLPVHAASPLPGTRRHVPEPSGRSDRSGEPARPEGIGPAARGGYRARVRRRRRPGVPDRRARAGRERFDRDGAGRQGDAQARAGCEHHLQRDLLVDRARGDRRERRRARPHPRRSLVHQAGHGGDGRDLRRRALRPLLLPGELPGGLRSDRRGDRAGAALGGERPTFRARSRRSAGIRHPARSTPR